MSSVLQRMAVIQAVPSAPEDADDEAAEQVRLAALMPADEVQLLYSLCLHGRAELGLAPDEYAALTMVLLRLLAFKPTDAKVAPLRVASPPQPQHQPPPPATEKKTLNPEGSPPPGQQLPVLYGQKTAPALSNQEVLAPEIVAVPVRQQIETRADAAAVQAASASLVPTEEGAFWHLTVAQLVASEAVAAMVRELALQSQLVARDTGHWLLRVERESLNQPQNRERLQTALQTAGHEVTLTVEIGRVTDSPARRNAAAAAEKQMAAEKIIFDDPFVQTMMRDFGGKIVPGSIKPI
jgi:DNA polymerase-3 subunit gamma/tau